MPDSLPPITFENLFAADWGDYSYLDSGGTRRLERFGGRIMDRPAPQAIWDPHLPGSRWGDADARFVRHSDGSGQWTFRAGGEPEPWTMTWQGLRFEVKPTGFGHLGLFPEQAPNWAWMSEVVGSARRSVSALNLFAYTGIASLALASGGARVTHLDAVKGVVHWASENARASGLGDAHIRWIVDDVQKFTQREVRRGRRYDAIVLDPPTFGRGKQGQVWKLDRDLPGLLRTCERLLSDAPLFVLLSAHTPGVTPVVLSNMLIPLARARGGRIQAGEMLLAGEKGSPPLPSGAYARWIAT